MSRKDYIAFAEMVRALRLRFQDSTANPNVVLESLEDELAYIFSSENTRFDGNRFHSACQTVKSASV